MRPKQQLRIHNIILILTLFLQFQVVAQCPISFSNPNQGVINVVLGANCSASFDASTRVNVQGNCTLVYFKDVALSIPYSGLPTFSGANLGQTIEVFVAAEDGNSSTPLSNPVKFTLKIIDAVPPLLTCPANLSYTASGLLCSVSIVEDIKAATTDNCNGSVNLTWTLSGASVASGANSLQGTSINVGKTIVLYTASDISNNVSTCTFSIDVNENIAPTLVSCPSDITQDAPSGTCQRIVVSGLTPTYSDNCTLNSNLTLNHELSGATAKSGIGSANNSIFNVGTTLVKYTAFDAFGNSNAVCSFNVTIRDIDRPQVVCPANLTLNSFTDSCFTSVPISNLTPFRLDNCGQNDLQTMISISGATTLSSTLLQQISNQKFFRGISTVTYLVTDKAGNTNTCAQSVIVNDVTKPKIFCNSSHINTTTASTECNVQVLLAQPTFSDNCSFANSLSLTYSLKGAINVGGLGFVPMSQQYVPGLTTVTYKATDESGNFAECSYNVTVIEVPLIKPILVCRNDTTVIAEIGKCNRLITSGLQPISASDNCTELSLLKLRVSLSGATIISDSLVSVNNGANGFTFNAGTTKVKYTLIDASGNSDTCSFNVIVRDIQRPVIQCITDLTLDAKSNCSQKAPNLQILATDNCSSAALFFNYKLSGVTPNPSQFTPINQVDFNIGITNVKFYVRDAANNVDSCSFNISVNENIAPSIICPQNQVVNTTDSTCNSILAILPSPQLSDNCPTSKTSWTFSSSGVSAVQGDSETKNIVLNYGKTIFTYTAKDFSSNTAQCSFEIQVRDNTLPKITCPNNISVNAYDTTCYAIVSSPALTFSDNCFANLTYTIKDVTGVDKLGNGIFANEILNIGPNIVTYRVSDNEANSKVCSFSINVLDVTKPTINCPLNTKLLANATNCTAILPTTSPITVSDNCSKLDISYAVTGVTIFDEQKGVITAKSFNLGKSIVTFKVTDFGANTATCTFEVEVTDKVRPVAKCKTGLTLALDMTGNAYMPAIMLDNGSSDNCTAVNQLSFESSKEYFNCSNLGLNTVFLTVKDAANNSSTCEATINVINSFSSLNLNVSTTIVNESYWGAKDGSATINVSGGNGDFTYLWNNNFDEPNQKDLAAGKYSITITDKISGCISVKDITIEQGPKLTISVGTIIGKANETILVPVRVQNFNKIRHLQFSLRLSNIGIGTIEGLQALGVSQDSLKANVIASSVNFSKTFLETNGMTLPNGSLLFNIRIKLNAPVGTYSNLNFQTVFYNLEARQLLPNGLTSIPINTNAGLVAVGNGAATADIKGKIIREDNTPINNVRLSLSGSYVDSFFTKKDGDFSFNLPLGAKVNILASKKDEVRRGLTAIDALLLQRHILGYDNFNSNYKKLAADVNKTGTLTALDVSEIKRVILGYQTGFRNVPIWQFVPDDVTFSATLQNQVPTYSDSLIIPYLLDNQINKNIIAIKTGDINLSADAATVRNLNKLFLNFEDKSINKNEEFTLSLNNEERLNLGALQMALQFDENDIEILSVDSKMLNQFEGSDFLIEKNKLNIVWTTAQFQEITEKSNIIDIKLRAKNKVASLKNKIWIDNNHLEPLAFDINVEKELVINIKSNEIKTNEFEKSLYPNPAQNFVYHQFSNGSKLSIYDTYGKVVKVINQINTNYLDFTDFENGTYFLKVENENYQKTEKLIIIK